MATLAGIDVDQVERFLKRNTIFYEKTTDAEGDPAFYCRFEMDSMGQLIKFSIYFYEQNEETKKYHAIQFKCGFGGGGHLLMMNQYNRRFRYGRAYLDTEGDSVVEMDILCHENMDPLLDEYLDRWKLAIAAVI